MLTDDNNDLELQPHKIDNGSSPFTPKTSYKPTPMGASFMKTEYEKYYGKGDYICSQAEKGHFRRV